MTENKQDIQNYVNDWNTIGKVEGINMGGLGISYDTAIQAIVMELLSWLLTTDITMEEHSDEIRAEISSKMDDVVDEYDRKFDQGFSGAMVMQAKTVAYQFWVYGLKHMMNKAKEEIPKRVMVFENPSIAVS